jgi:hypothetical protein
MRIEEVKVYTVDELSESAKEKAYYKWHENHEYFWASDNEKTLKAFEEVFPVSVTSWEYDTCTYHVRFEFEDDLLLGYESEIDMAELSGLRLAKYLYNNYEHTLFKGKFYFKNGKSRHSKLLFEKNNCNLTGYYMDCEIMQPIYDFLKNPCEHTTFTDLMKECLDNWGAMCVKDFDCSLSMEAFIESSEANDYEFYEDGRLF